MPPIESLAPLADSIFESRGVAETQPTTTSHTVSRIPGDGSDASSSSTMMINLATEASGLSLVTGLPPSGTLKRNKQRRIEVDYSLLHDDDTFSQASTSTSSSCRSGGESRKGTVTKENDQNVHNVVPLRRRELLWEEQNVGRN